MLKDLKEKLESLNKALSLLSSKAVIGAEAATRQMKKRIFVEGLRFDLKPIGKYQTGRRTGRSVVLKDTGALERSIKVEPTGKGAKVVAVGQGEKIKFIEKRYGKVFVLSKDEIKIIFGSIKK
jgi:hypothetical protein